MDSQAPSCAAVGALKAPPNHSRVAGENLPRTLVTTTILPLPTDSVFVPAAEVQSILFALL